MKIGVLSLQGAVSEHFRPLGRCGAEVMGVKQPGDLEGIRGLVIPGGESTTMGLLMHQFGLDSAVRERSRQGMPVFGTCAGMVLLSGEALDGTENQVLLGLMDTKVRRNAFGRQKESFETELAIQADGRELSVTGVFIRAPVIVEAGPGVTPLASLDEGIVAAREGRMLAAAFHPELTDDLSMYDYFLELCR